MTSALSDSIKLEKNFVNAVPGDPEPKNFRRQVNGICYSNVQPMSVGNPHLIAYAKNLAEELGFSQGFCESQGFVDVFAGQALLTGSQPFAMCYGGHQFGQWAGQLGDGRAINLGEIRDRSGHLQSLQLKGAGPTPYSRTADGLAVVRSSIREFLCSEAMHALGVPTTRALSVIGTGEKVMRDMFYDGNSKHEPGAVVCRVAPSFIRFGNFEIHASRQEHELLKRLADYTITQYFPELDVAQEDVYLQWFESVADRTARLMVEWMRVGFVHGVMNTDNMSIHGLTIDYGPYGWLDNFDPDWTPNTTDFEGRRYCYANQPGIAQWNLLQLGNAIHPIVKDAKALEAIIAKFSKLYERQWQAMMASKLGLSQCISGDEKIFAQLQQCLHQSDIDVTLFFRQLATFPLETIASSEISQQWPQFFSECLYRPHETSSNTAEELSRWFVSYGERLKQESCPHEARAAMMNAVNPKYVLRNYLAQLAIDKAYEQDFSLVNTLLQVMQNPYEEQPEFQEYAAKRPGWAKERPGCSMLSCSS